MNFKNVFAGAALSLVAATSFVMPVLANDDCVAVNAAGGPGYVNVREFPDLDANVITRLSNPSHGSDWGSAYWCGSEAVDDEGRVWSLIQYDTKDGRFIRGWVSDKVLHFLD